MAEPLAAPIVDPDLILMNAAEFAVAKIAELQAADAAMVAKHASVSERTFVAADVDAAAPNPDVV